MSTLKEYRIEVTMHIVNSDGKPVDWQGRAEMEGKVFSRARTGYTVADADSIESAIAQMDQFKDLTKAVAFMIEQDRYDSNPSAQNADYADQVEAT